MPMGTPINGSQMQSVRQNRHTRTCAVILLCSTDTGGTDGGTTQYSESWLTGWKEITRRNEGTTLLISSYLS
ncbi:hypothetical protein DPMN_052619 [Dreissena polymorpha]|uniref:Uncharacterized protein n=1 Tax=Dreissena polymorpha TaxID=45954 RepID=A0A9D4CK04_DREPO|nr:hypothetical protein DPMN_052619 [Dreissena polymorpha]